MNVGLLCIIGKYSVGREVATYFVVLPSYLHNRTDFDLRSLDKVPDLGKWIFRPDKIGHCHLFGTFIYSSFPAANFDLI